MPRRGQVPSLSPHAAKYILSKAIDDGKVTAADVKRYQTKMVEEASALQIRLEQLRGMMEPLRHPGRAVRRIARRVKKASAEVLASRQLQGRYIAAIRTVPKNQRAKYAKMAKQEGREKAIAAIKRET